MEHYKEGGPAFIDIGGESRAFPKFKIGLWYNLSMEHNAAMFTLEHRYYGESHPTQDMSTRNMTYLSSRQALQDLAMFMANMTERYNLTRPRPWVSFGCSYAGSLSAWLKLKFPHMMSGAVSKSSPLLAKADHFEFFEVVKDALKDHSNACLQGIEEAIYQIRTLIETNKVWELKYLFKTCRHLDVTNIADIKSFMLRLIIFRFGWYVNVTLDGVEKVCDIMENQNENRAIDRFAYLNSEIMKRENHGNNTCCWDHEFRTIIDNLSDTNWNSSWNDPFSKIKWRSFLWQTCTEFGWFPTINQVNMPFDLSLDIDFYISLCSSAFPELEFDKKSVEKHINTTNVEYGGINPDISNIVFVHGSADSWHTLGVIKDLDLDKSTTAIFNSGLSHCQNNENGKEKISKLVATWLN